MNLNSAKTITIITTATISLFRIIEKAQTVPIINAVVIKSLKGVVFI